MAEHVSLYNVTQDALLARSVTVARRWRERHRGLLGTAALPPSSGLWIRPCRQVHMRGMRYPLLAVYLSRSGHVLACPVLNPGERGPWLWRAAGVVELSALLSPSVNRGDVLTWTRGDPDDSHD